MSPVFGMLDENDIYHILTNRLKRKYHIDLERHIKKIIKKYPNTGDGLDFFAYDTEDLIKAITKAGFRYDDPNNFCEKLASLATAGKGFREPDASPAFHFQIANQITQSANKNESNHCNVHLDAYGFVSIAPDGTKYYNPDLFQHIIGDFAWPIIQQKFISKLPFISSFTHNFTNRLYLIILPTSKTAYQSKIEERFNLFQTNHFTSSLNWQWSTALRPTRSNLNFTYQKNNYTVSADLSLGSRLSQLISGVMINLEISKWGSR